MKVSYIKWLDAAGTTSNSWQPDDDMSTKLMPVDSAGVVFSEDSESVTLVTSKTSWMFMGDLTIPKISIVERRDFEV